MNLYWLRRTIQLNQRVAELYLAELGFSVDIAENGAKTLEALANGNYSLILMDCQMPEMDGLTATKMIRKNETTTGMRWRSEGCDFSWSSDMNRPPCVQLNNTPFDMYGILPYNSI